MFNSPLVSAFRQGRNVEVQVRRPNRYHSELRSTRHHRELIFDGSAITLLNHAQNFYGTVPVSGSLDDAMDLACEQFGITMPFEDFIRSDPHNDLLKKGYLRLRHRARHSDGRTL